MVRQNLLYSLRTLRRAPGFTAAAVLTAALGIGANTAIFSVIDGVLLRPLPFAQPEDLVLAWESNAEGGMPLMFASPPNLADWRAQARSFEALGAWTTTRLTLAGDGGPRRLPAARLSAELLPMLGVAPLAGRVFSADDDRPGGPPVAILSHALWQQHFGGDPAAVGRTVELEGVAHTVIGVMPRRFRFPPALALEGSPPSEATALWVPLGIDAAGGQRGAHYLTALGRLAAGTDLAAAQAELESVAARLEAQYPSSNQGWSVRLVPLVEQMTGGVRPALLVLLATVALVLLLACANVANLLLARGVGRRRELAVRAALGAGRGRLVAQLMTESLVLAIAGGIAGLLLAAVAVQALGVLAPSDLPRLDEIRLDGRVLAFTALLSVLAGVGFGLAPALQVGRVPLSGTLAQRGAAGAAAGTRTLRAALVIAEVALALVVVAGALLMARSFLRLRAVDTGFQATRAVTLATTLPPGERDQRAALVARLTAALADLPAVEAAGAINQLPLAEDRQGTSYWPADGPEPPPNESQHTNFSFATPGYFEAMGIPLLAGRAFEAGDRLDGRQVAVINRALAERAFPGRDPIGQRLKLGFRSTPFEVVGVVGDVRHSRLAEAAVPNVYGAYLQLPANAQVTLVLRTDARPAALLDAVRSTVHGIDPRLPVDALASMDRIVAGSVAQERFAALLLTSFALLALALAAIGIYGVVSYGVRQRRREIGVRVALGAHRRDILRLIVGGGMRLALAGIACGLLGAYWLTRFLASLLFEIRPTDPYTYAAVAAILVTVTLAACWLPARRATAIDPMASLRVD